MTTVVGGPNGATSNTSSLTSTVSIPELDFADGGGNVTDVRPAWGESLPAWANDLVAMLTAGQPWPEASESKLWELARAHKRLVEVGYGGVDPLGAAAVTLRDGWQAPSFMGFAERLETEYSQNNGLLAAAGNHYAYALQADGFARDTQHTKISINIAFWIALIAAAIALTAAFFSAGTSTSFLGPIAAASRARMLALMARLTGKAGVPAMTRALTMGTRLASSSSLTARMLRSPFGREIIEELGEELFIEIGTQLEQMRRGTRRDFDWKRILAAGVGAGVGAVIGMRVGRPVSSLVNRMPLIRGLNRAAGDAPGILNAFRRFPGRVMNTALINVFASGGGGFLANGLVYGQWEMPTGESLLGAAMAGAGRTNTISPFNPDVITAVTNPVTALAEAQYRSEVADAIAGSHKPPTQGGEGTSSGNGPTPPSGPQQQSGQGASMSAVQPDGPQGSPSGARQTSRPPSPEPTGTQDSPKSDQSAPKTGQNSRGGQTPSSSPTAVPLSASEGPAQPLPNTGGARQPQTPDSGGARNATADHASSSQRPGDGNNDGNDNAPSADPQRENTASESVADEGTGTVSEPVTGEDATPESAGRQGDPVGEESPANRTSGTPDSTVASDVLTDTLRVIAPDAVLDPDGNGMLVSGVAGHTVRISDEDLAPIMTWLETRARQGVDEQYLAAEAAAELGRLIADRSDGAFPASMMLETLARLADSRPDTHDAVTSTAREVLLETDLTGWSTDELSHKASRLLEKAFGLDVQPRHSSLQTLQASADEIFQMLERARLGAETQRPAAAATPAIDRGRTRRMLGNGRPPGNSRFQADGRPAHEKDVSLQEIREAVRRLVGDDFSDLNVITAYWAGDTNLLRVEVQGRSAQYFRFSVGRVRGGKLTRIRVREGSQQRPHHIRVAPRVAEELLPRVVLRDISYTLQALDNPQPQGVLRRLWNRGEKADTDAFLKARINDYNYLSRQWHESLSSQQRLELIRDIERLTEELTRLGHTPPAPPWGSTPVSLLDAVRAAVADHTNALNDAIKDSLKLFKHRLRRESEARAEARKAREKAIEAQRQKDLHAAEREEAALVEEENHRADEARHRHMKEVYRAAVLKGIEVRNVYRNLAEALAALPADQLTPTPDILQLSQTARRLHEEYVDLVARTRLSSEVVSAGVAGVTLPRMTRSTDVANALLARNGVDYRFTVDELHGSLKAEFRQLVSEDGIRLRVGKDAELVVQLVVLGDLVEVPFEVLKVAETIVGDLPQVGHWISASAAFARTFKRTIDFLKAIRLMRALADKLPFDLPDSGFDLAGMTPEQILQALRWVADHLVAESDRSYGRGEGRSGSATEKGQGGAVQDNRGQSTVWVAENAFLRMKLVTPNGEDQAEVRTGNPEDAQSLHIALSHAYDPVPSGSSARLDRKDWQKTEFPEHSVTGMTGLQKLFEDTVAKLPDEREVGDKARGRVLNLLLYELPALLKDAINRPDGLTQPLVVGGRHVGTISVKTEVKMDTARREGSASRQHFLERLRVGVIRGGGTQSASTSQRSEIRGGLAGKISDEALPTEGYGIGPKATVPAYVRGISTSESLSAESTAYDVNVRRWTGHTQGYVLEMEHTVTIDLKGEEEPRVIKGSGKGLFRIPEPDAYRYGLPVAAEAVVEGSGLHARLRDDPTMTPPKGRVAELPEWMGNGTGRMRGAGGMSQVQVTQDENKVKEIDRVIEDTKKELQRRGLLPEEKWEGGKKRYVYSSDPVRRAGQMQNKEMVDKQLTRDWLETHYNQATQEGLLLPLIDRSAARPDRHYNMRIRLEQHLSDLENKGFDRARPPVNLPIASNTLVHGQKQTRISGSGQGINVGFGVSAEDLQGSEERIGLEEVSAGAKRAPSEYTETTKSKTVNNVNLGEGTMKSWTVEIRHTLTTELVKRDGTLTPLASGDAWINMTLPGELLPEEAARTQPKVSFPMTGDVSRRVKTMHGDIPGIMDAVQRLFNKLYKASSLPSKLYNGALRSDSQAYYIIASALNGLVLRMSPQTLYYDGPPPHPDPDQRTYQDLEKAYGIRTAVQPSGLSPTTFSVWVRGFPKRASVISVGPNVIGDILMTLRGYGTTRGFSSSVSANGGLKGGDHQGPDADSVGYSAGVGISGEVNTGSARGENNIRAVEQIFVDTGLHYWIVTELDVEVIAQMPGGKPISEIIPGTVLQVMAERDALDLYADGKVDLPFFRVADAVQRLYDGSLKLDRRIAVRLVRRYLEDSRSADAQSMPVQGPDRKKLVDKLKEKFPKDTVKGERPQDQIEEMLAAVRQVERVTVAPQYRQNPAMIFDAELVDAESNKRTTLHDAIVDAVKQVVPLAVENDPVLWKALRDQFVGESWWGEESYMRGPHGLVRSYPVRIARHVTEKLKIEVRAELDDSFELVSEVDGATLIKQLYDYGEEKATVSWGHVEGASASGAVDGSIPDGGISSDLSYKLNASYQKQRTQIQGSGTFNGAYLVRQPVEFTIDVSRPSDGKLPHPVKAATVAVAERTAQQDIPSAQPSKTVKLRGMVYRLIPDGMVAKEGTVDEPTPAPSDPRPVRQIGLSQPRGVHAPGLFEAVYDRIQQKDLLGKAGKDYQEELLQELSGDALAVKLKRLTQRGGAPAIAIRHGDKRLEVYVEAVLYSPAKLASGAEGELRDVNRMQHLEEASIERGRALPVGREIGTGYDPVGVSGTAASGEQASSAVGYASGTRRETSGYVRGPGTETEEEVYFNARLELYQESADGSRKHLRTVHMPGVAQGDVYMLRFEPDVEQMLAQRDKPSGPPPFGAVAPQQPRDSIKSIDLAEDAKTRPEYQQDPIKAMAALLRERFGGNPVRIESPPAPPYLIMVKVREAQYLARELGVNVHYDVKEANWGERNFVVTPTGEIYGDGLIRAFAALSPELVDAVGNVRRRSGGMEIDLRALYESDPDNFTARLTEKLESLGEQIPDRAKQPVSFPVKERIADALEQGVNTSYLGQVNSRPLRNSDFVADGRPAGMDDLTLDEVSEAVATMQPSDLGADVLSVSWDAEETTLRVETRRRGTHTWRIQVGVPPKNRPARTLVSPEGEHKTTLHPRLAPMSQNEVLARVLVHEVGDTFQKLETVGQGRFRRFLNILIGGQDMCATGRLADHRYLSRKWEATDDADERERLRSQIEAVAQAMRERVQVPPQPPWVTAVVGPPRRVETVWDVVRKLSNPSGWIPQCTCPSGEPCTCGRRVPSPEERVPSPEENGEGERRIDDRVRSL